MKRAILIAASAALLGGLTVAAAPAAQGTSCPPMRIGTPASCWILQHVVQPTLPGYVWMPPRPVS